MSAPPSVPRARVLGSLLVVAVATSADAQGHYAGRERAPVQYVSAALHGASAVRFGGTNPGAAPDHSDLGFRLDPGRCYELIGYAAPPANVVVSLAGSSEPHTLSLTPARPGRVARETVCIDRCEVVSVALDAEPQAYWALAVRTLARRVPTAACPP